MKNSISLLLIVFITSVIAGCSSEPDSVLTPVKGVVLLDGKPAEGIQIQMMPDALAGVKGPSSSAISGPDGTFVMKTDKGEDGAVIGKHKIIAFDTLAERPAQGQEAKPPRLNTKYGTLNAGLTETVEPGKDITINLTK